MQNKYLRVLSFKSGLRATQKFIATTLFLTGVASANNVSACNTITVQAENYNWQNGTQTAPVNDTGGGSYVGWLDSGDWMAYQVNIPETGQYQVSYRIASPKSTGRVRLEGNQGATVYGALDIPNTGGWQKWRTISHQVSLSKGSQSLAIAAYRGGWNLNWFTLTPQNCNGGVTAKTTASKMGKGFNLGQTFESTQHPRDYWESKRKIDAYYAKGFRNVRIPITWTENVGGNKLVYNSNIGNVNRGHERLAVIKRLVDYALSLNGMYVIINAHHEKGIKEGNKANVLEHLWQDIADIFKDRNKRLIYEILNEPHKADGSAMGPWHLRNMTGKAYKKIRAVDPTRIIVIGGNQWFAAEEMAVTWPHLNEVGNGNDKYLMATFHHYNPWSFNGDNQGSYDDPWTDADIYQPMDIMKNWANSVGKGMPVYIGEWGTGWGSRYSTMQCNNIRLWYQKLESQYASAKGQPTSVWDDGGWFKIYDHGTDSFNNNLIDCISGNCSWDGGNRFNNGCL